MNLPPILVLAGGMGTRIAHLAGDLPKCLIPVNGRPFLEWQLDLFEKNKIQKIILCVNYKEQSIRDHLEANPRPKIHIEVISDGSNPLGTGGAILKSTEYLEEEFMVVYGDSYLNCDYAAFYNYSKNFNACTAIYRNNNAYDVSNVKIMDNGKIFYDKNNTDSSLNYIDYGMTYFKTGFFRSTSQGINFDLAEQLNWLSRKHELFGYEVHERFYEVGSENGLNEFAAYLSGKNE